MAMPERARQPSERSSSQSSPRARRPADSALPVESREVPARDAKMPLANLAACDLWLLAAVSHMSRRMDAALLPTVETPSRAGRPDQTGPRAPLWNADLYCRWTGRGYPIGTDVCERKVSPKCENGAVASMAAIVLSDSRGETGGVYARTCFVGEAHRTFPT